MPINAYAAHERGAALQPFTYEPQPLRPTELQMQVTHCGICHSDIHLIDDDWGMGGFPLVAGHEVVGTITRVGESVEGLAVGDRVGVGWQSSACMSCEWCVGGDENLCPTQGATAVGHMGGFAEEMVVDSRFAFPIPRDLPSDAVAPLFCGGITVYSPIREYAAPGSRVGVIGIGGLGHMALRFANAYGCEVTAFSTSPDKEAEAKSHGAHHFLVSKDAGMFERQAGTLDLLLATATADLEWKKWFELLRPKGVLCVLSPAPSDVALQPFSLIAGRKKLVGSNIGNREQIAEMLRFAALHDVTAQIETLPMSEINAALDKVRANQARYRMVLVN